MPASATTCAATPNFYSTFYSAEPGDTFGYEPVPCDAGPVHASTSCRRASSRSRSASTAGSRTTRRSTRRATRPSISARNRLTLQGYVGMVCRRGDRLHDHSRHQADRARRSIDRRDDGRRARAAVPPDARDPAHGGSLARRPTRQGKIGGFLHLIIGQEAVCVGAIAALEHEGLRRRDVPRARPRVRQGRRARGRSSPSSTARRPACVKGLGGSMHLFDKSDELPRRLRHRRRSRPDRGRRGVRVEVSRRRRASRCASSARARRRSAASPRASRSRRCGSCRSC